MKKHQSHKVGEDRFMLCLNDVSSFHNENQSKRFFAQKRLNSCINYNNNQVSGFFFLGAINAELDS